MPDAVTMSTKEFTRLTAIADAAKRLMDAMDKFYAEQTLPNADAWDRAEQAMRDLMETHWEKKSG